MRTFVWLNYKMVKLVYAQKIKNALAEDVPDFQTSQTFVIVVLQSEKKEYPSMAVK
jgi:hypothetical protein